MDRGGMEMENEGLKIKKKKKTSKIKKTFVF